MTETNDNNWQVFYYQPSENPVYYVDIQCGTYEEAHNLAELMQKEGFSAEASVCAEETPDGIVHFEKPLYRVHINCGKNENEQSRVFCVLNNNYYCSKYSS